MKIKITKEHPKAYIGDTKVHLKSYSENVESNIEVKLDDLKGVDKVDYPDMLICDIHAEKKYEKLHSSGYQIYRANRSFHFNIFMDAPIEEGVGLDSTEFYKKVESIAEKSTFGVSVGESDAERLRYFTYQISWESGDLYTLLNMFLKDAFSIIQTAATELPDLPESTGDLNRVMVLSAATALASLDDFSEVLRTSNKLSVEFPDHKESILEYLARLREGLVKLIEVVDLNSDAIGLNENANIESGYWYHLIKEMEHYLSPESRAKITVPAVLTFSCGTLGALLGGPIGFGAGSMTAAYLLGQSSSKVVADKIEKAILKNDSD